MIRKILLVLACAGMTLTPMAAYAASTATVRTTLAAPSASLLTSQQGSYTDPTTQIGLQWAPVKVTSVKGYRFGYSTTDSRAATPSWTSAVIRVASAPRPFVFTSLVSGATYKVFVETVYTSGRAARTTLTGTTTAATTTTPVATPPGAVPTPTVTNLTQTTMTVNWQPPVDPGSSAVDGYQVGWGTWDSAMLASTARSVDLNNFTADTSYTIRVRAHNAVGYGPWSYVTVRTLAPAPTPTVPTGSLTWSPPACGGSGYTCTDLYLSNTGSNQAPSLASNVDYRIHLPASGPLVGGLMIRGGHNVQVIGGEIDLTYPCSDSSSACHGIYVNKATAGEVYLEGVWIRNPKTIPASCSATGMPCSTGDGIVVDTQRTSTPPNLTMQNIRIDGISGCSGGSDHADIFQPYQAGGSLIKIDHLTGTSNCQGFQIDPDLSSANPPSYIIKNTNLNVIPNPYSGNANRYMWWLTGGTSGCDSGQVTLSNAYAQEPNGSLSINSVWPDTDQPSTCRSAWSAPTVSFLNSPQITGTITAGLPPGGDFVSGVGTGYVSPGYQP